MCGGVIEDIGDFVGDTVSGVADTAGALISDPIGTIGNVVENAIENPLETAAKVAVAYYAPSLLAETIAADTAFVAADAASLAEQGLSAAQIADTLAVSGVDAMVAADAASLASQGLNAVDIANNIAQYGSTPFIAPTEVSVAESLLSSQPTTDYLGTQALGDSTTGAVGSTATPSTVGQLSTNVSNIGIQAPELANLGSLGGTAAMDVGTAGLTAEQLAQATANAQVGSNASSGLGYLGGAESLPSGTAGIQGVTTPTTLSLSDAQRGLKLANTLFGQQPQQQAGLQQRQIQPYGVVDYSPTLSLLNQRVRTPNIYSLLG